MLRDLRFAARGLARTPGFTFVAVLSLALGIMATTAIYSVVHAVILDPFPYKDVDHLMSVRVANTAQRGGRTNYSVDQFVEFAERNTIFDGVIASTISDVVWTGDGEPRRLRGNHGTFNTFDVMGVPPLIGRTMRRDDETPGAEPVVVLGYQFWQREFGGDSGVLGRRLRLNDTVRTIIGVMPKRFMWRGADVYLPIPFQRGTIVENVRSVHLLGRLKPGITAARAEADLAPIVTDLKKREPAQFPDAWRVGLLPFKQTFPSDIAGDIWGLLGAVVLLLLIACANVSNLLLSRAATRQREMTVRTALGASRTRLIRQLLTESLLLSSAAGALGVALAYAALPGILALVPPDTIPDEADIRLNGAVLIFALLVSVLVSVACGLAPALHTSRRDLAASMREVSRSLAGSSRQALLRKALVVAEVALALMLLSGSGTLVRRFTALQRIALDAPADRVLTMRIPLTPRRYPDAARRIAFFNDLLARVNAVPGVAVGALNSGLHPLGNMAVVADVPGEPGSTDPVEVHQISAGYPNAVGLSLAAGRFFSEADVSGNGPVALVNERFVRARLASSPAIGRVVRVPRLKDPPFSAPNYTFEIVGVVRDALNNGLTEPVVPEVYIPFTAAGTANLLVVRASNDAASVARPVTAQVYAIDPGQPVTSVNTLETILRDEAFSTPRFNLILLSLFAAAGLVLAVVGVYGVMSSAVAQERQEIGIRVALGAAEGQIARMIIWRGGRLLLVGVAAGLAGSVAAGRILAQEFWRAATFDPAAFTAVSALLLATGVLACALPAVRAMRVDPIVVLRHD